MTAKEVCRQVYSGTRDFYETKLAALGANGHGFHVLYGPPCVNPPLYFLGYQLGGDKSHSRLEEHEGWPAESNYATGDPRQSLFWRQVQYVWDASALARSTSLNAIFFRHRASQNGV